MNLLKKITHDNTVIVKTVLPVFLAFFLLLLGTSSNARSENDKCRVQPDFEKRKMELQQRTDSGIEKPAFEKPRFESEKISKPMFEKPLIEKPVFEQGWIQFGSQAANKTSENAKIFVPFPDESVKKWSRISSERHNFHVISHHELKLRRPPIYRR
jgi:hypothetical protein